MGVPARKGVRLEEDQRLGEGQSVADVDINRRQSFGSRRDSLEHEKRLSADLEGDPVLVSDGLEFREAVSGRRCCEDVGIALTRPDCRLEQVKK
jgi:hypothetical protein